MLLTYVMIAVGLLFLVLIVILVVYGCMRWNSKIPRKVLENAPSDTSSVLTTTTPGASIPSPPIYFTPQVCPQVTVMVGQTAKIITNFNPGKGVPSDSVQSMSVSNSLSHCDLPDTDSSSHA